MAGLFLDPLGEQRTVARQASSISLALGEIDKRIIHLQIIAIQSSTRKGYMTGARSYYSQHSSETSLVIIESSS